MAANATQIAQFSTQQASQPAGGRRQGRSLKIRRPPAGGAGRVQIYVLILPNLKVPGAPPLPPAPPKSDPKSDSKSDPENFHIFDGKMEPQGTPKGTQNSLKSAKMLPRTPPERV